MSKIGAPTCQSWQFTRSPFRHFERDKVERLLWLRYNNEGHERQWYFNHRLVKTILNFQSISTANRLFHSLSHPFLFPFMTHLYQIPHVKVDLTDLWLKRFKIVQPTMLQIIKDGCMCNTPMRKQGWTWGSIWGRGYGGKRCFKRRYRNWNKCIYSIYIHTSHFYNRNPSLK